jgi:purine-binding chemotaxis protein CheW
MFRQIATFMLGETILGVDILLVKEVYRKTDLTPIPDAPEHLCGLMNLRGRVVTVIDLNICLGRPPSEFDDESRLLILKTDEEILPYQNRGVLESIKLGEDITGFLIDRMDDVIDVDESEILPPPPNLDSVEEDLVAGVIKRGEKLVILLDVTAILDRVIGTES